MDAQQFNEFIEKRLEEIKKILIKKGAEYVPEGQAVSRFHNFDVGAALNRQTPEQTLWGFVTKHIVSVSDMVKVNPQAHSLAQWDEKLGDIEVYMLLLHAMVHNREASAVVSHVNAESDSPLTKAFADANRDYEAKVAAAASATVGNDSKRIIHHTEYGANVAEDSQDGEKEAEFGILETSVVPTQTFNAQEIHIHNEGLSDEHKAWLRSVTPPSDPEGQAYKRF